MAIRDFCDVPLPYFGTFRKLWTGWFLGGSEGGVIELRHKEEASIELLGVINIGNTSDESSKKMDVNCSR